MAEPEHVHRLRNLLVELRSALARERRGVSSLDTEVLLEANRRKGELIAEIEAAQQAVAAHDAGVDVKTRSELRKLADEVRLAAQSNALLLNEAGAMVKHVLGTGGSANGYDRNARPQHEVRRAFAKTV